MNIRKDISPTVPFDYHPVQLLIGSAHTTMPTVEHILQKQFCSNDGCTYCTECYKIRMRQHHALMWITPEKMYTRELIEPILHTIQFQRTAQEPFFFVLQDADFLTDSCANALLKSLEEPPIGYYFILLASRKQMVLPTIRSRCIVHHMEQHDIVSDHQTLFDHFSQKTVLSAIQFLQIIEKSEINEKESIELIDALLAHCHLQIRSAIEHENQEAYKKANIIMRAVTTLAEKPPMPGSAKLFWKNLFLQM